MDAALEALPARPLSAEDVATLNEASALELVPFSWYGEQVIALLLLYDERRAGDGGPLTPDPADDTSEGAAADDETTTASERAATSTDEALSRDDAGDPSPGDDQQASESDEATSSFDTDDSEGVGTVEVIDSGDLTPDDTNDEFDESLAPDLGGDTSGDEPGDPAEPATDSDSTATGEAADDPVDERADDPAPDEGLGSPLPGATEDDEDRSGQQRRAGEPAEDTLHVYAVGFDGGVDAWVAIAEIDPDADLADAEPLFEEWATRTYHDQIVDRLAIGPSEYGIDE